MSIDFADAYMVVLFANFLYLVGLLYGGMWYTKQTTVKCPQCGIRYAKYRVGQHECHPELLDRDGPFY